MNQNDNQTTASTPGLTDEQRFHFDLKGWACIPGVLDEATTEACREYVKLIHESPEQFDSITKERPSLTGPTGELLDHSVLTAILSEIIGKDAQPLEGEGPTGYGFRCESTFTAYRRFGEGNWAPHCGNRGQTPHRYSCVNGTIYSGQTRAVWEFNPVEPGDGGTQFLSGSHRSDFDIPDSYMQEDSAMFESYACPAGSLIIFCERTMHSGCVWRNEKWPRVGLFNCYNHAEAQVHKLAVPHELVMTMPEKRRTLFRGVWRWWNRKGGPRENNTSYSVDNQAL